MLPPLSGRPLLAADVPTDAMGAGAGWAAGLVESLGAPGVGIAILLENLLPPIPSEVVLPLAGFATATGDLGLLSVLFWSTLGSVLGALALYALGHWLGEERLEAAWGKVPLSNPRDIERGMRVFERHGQKAILFARMVPVIRSAISVPAGVARMPLPRYTILTALGSLAWNAALVGAGRALGDRWELVAPFVSRAALVVLALGTLWLAVMALRRLRHRTTSPADAA